jgi:hypothetical protein
MQFDAPIEFREATRLAAQKKIMPTSLTSAELAQLNKQILRNSMTSAQTTIEGLLDRYKSGIENIVGPSFKPGEDFNPAKLRSFIQDYLRGISYTAPASKEGTIEDLSSDGRVGLVIDTNVKLAHGAGRFVQQNANSDVVDLWPALEFTRFEERDQERPWEGVTGYWMQAARRAGDMKAVKVYGETGRMVALKDSDIWDELGDPDYVSGGLGNPYPPFAFGSGMWTEEVSRDEAEELGLLEEGEEAKPAKFDFGSLLEALA